MKLTLLISLLLVPVISQAQPQQKPSKAEVEQMVAKLNSNLVITAAAAQDAKNAEYPRTVAVAIPVVEEMKSNGFICYLTTWHMSGRMIQYKWITQAIRPESEYPYFEVRLSTELKTPKITIDDLGKVIETKEEWEPAEASSQVAQTLGDISLKIEGIHQTIRTDSVVSKKARFSTGLLIYPQLMSISSGLNNVLGHGFSVSDMEKVEVQKHPGFDAKNFPPTKPNEFQCFLLPKY